MLPRNNGILNSKDKKKLLKVLVDQFGIEALPDGVYIQNSKGKVLYINRDVEKVLDEKLFIDSLGLYIGAWLIDGFRLSIEGAQLFGPSAKKGYIELSDEESVLWMKGQDMPWKGEDGVMIVKHKDDTLGCGKVKTSDKGTVLLNYTPKSRRLVVVNQ